MMELRLPQVSARLSAAAQASGEPLCAYVYDLEALRRHAMHLAASLPPRCDLFYAIKANSELPLLRTLAPVVHGFEVSSGGELAWIGEHFAGRPVIFSGPGKTDAELSAAVARRVDCLHVESLLEMQRLAHILEREDRQQGVLLRINLPLDQLAETTLVMGGKPTPFGIPAEQLAECLAWLHDFPRLQLRGFHFHLMSHQLDAQRHLAMLEACLAKVAEWRERFGLAIDHINLGGGIGINYREPERQFDWEAFSAGLAELVARRLPDDLRLRFELGRYMTAACGYYAMQVIDIKRSYGKTFAVGRGGTHHFRTPQAQGHSHPFHVVPVDAWPHSYQRPAAVAGKVNVVGQLCTPKDLLAFDAPVEALRVGDLVVFPYAGAYGWHISHHDFLRHPPPEQLFLPSNAPLIVGASLAKAGECHPQHMLDDIVVS